MLLLVLPGLAQTPRRGSGVDPRFYDYDAQTPFAATETPLRTEDGIKISVVTYPSPVKTPYAANNLVTAYLFLPSGPGPHPVMLVEHEWLPKTLDTEFRMCLRMARSRVAAFLIVQPYALMRRPTGHANNAELITGNVPLMLNSVRQMVLDGRRGMDWLQARPNIDPKKMGVSGISLGAIFAPLVAGADPRARVVLTIVGGADVSDIMWDSLFAYGMKPEMIGRGYDYESLKKAMAPIESTNWLHDRDPRDAILFNSRYDVLVARKQAQHLARALGGAPIVWVNSGHYGMAFAEAPAEDLGAKFLEARFFGAPPPALPDSLPGKTIKLGFLVGGHEGVSPDLAYQIVNFDRQARYSLDGQLTLHGLSAALSGRIDTTKTVGLEFPLLHGKVRPRPFLLFHITL